MPISRQPAVLRSGGALVVVRVQRKLTMICCCGGILNQAVAVVTVTAAAVAEVPVDATASRQCIQENTAKKSYMQISQLSSQCWSCVSSTTNPYCFAPGPVHCADRETFMVSFVTPFVTAEDTGQDPISVGPKAAGRDRPSS